jgi:hypothetical protein
MNEPGFKVLHIQDLDFQSHCLTLKACLAILGNAQRSAPMYVMIEPKVETPPSAPPGTITWTVPLPMTDALWNDLESEVKQYVEAVPPILFLIDSSTQQFGQAYMALKEQNTSAARYLIPSIEGLSAQPTGWEMSVVYVKCNIATQVAPPSNSPK